MIDHMINLTSLAQFYIITYPKVDLLLIIYHLTYLIFLFNFLKKLIESTNAINILIELAKRLTCGVLLLLTNVRT